MQALRRAERDGFRAGLTEADILLVIGNTITSRGDLDKKRVPGMLRTVREQLTINKYGLFEKCGELTPDLKPKQPLWRLVRDAYTESVPETSPNVFVPYYALGLERFMLSIASARYIPEDKDDAGAKDKSFAKKPSILEYDDDDDDDNEGVAPAPHLQTKSAKNVSQKGKDKDVDVAMQGAPASTRGKKRARGGGDTEDAQKTVRARLATPKEPAAKAAQEAAAKEAAAKAAQEAAAKEAAAKAAQEAAAANATKEAAERKRIAEAEEQRRMKEAKDARVREAQEKLRTLRREKDERHPGFPSGIAGGSGLSGGSSDATATGGAAGSSAEALEARRLWEADAAWWSKHGPKAVDPDSGTRRLFTKTSETSRWHFTEVQKSFPDGFVYVADDHVVDEVRRRLVLGMPAAGAHLLAKKIHPDTAIVLCRVSSSSDRGDRGKGGSGTGGSRPRLDLDVYGAAEPYPHAEKGAPPVSVDATAFGGRLPAQIKLRARRCFGVSLRDDLGSAAVSGGLVDLRGVSLKTQQRLERAESLMPVLLKNAKRTDALVAELRARAREVVRARRGFP